MSVITKMCQSLYVGCYLFRYLDYLSDSVWCCLSQCSQLQFCIWIVCSLMDLWEQTHAVRRYLNQLKSMWKGYQLTQMFKMPKESSSVD